MSLASVSIRRPMLIIMSILAVVVFGIVAYIRMPVDMMPEMDFPYVTVQTVYIGAGPEELERSVIEPIEEQMTTIAGLKNMTASCMEGVGFIFLEFELGVDADLAAIDVKDKIDAILYKLPQDLQKPVIGKFDPSDQPILQLSISGPIAPEKLREIADGAVKDRLVRIKGVGKVEVVGGRQREIQVNLRKQKLDAHGLTVYQVAALIAGQTANFPAGHVTGKLREYTVRVEGEFESIDQIANLRIPAMTSGRDPVEYAVRLSDIAEIVDTHKEVRELSRLNGMDAVGVSVYKRPDANAVDVVENINKQLVSLRAELPPGFEVVVSFDRSRFIRDAVDDSNGSLQMGIVLTALVLFLFLLDWKVTIIAVVTMPASIVMSYVGMKWLGFSLNIITLMSLGISVGVLVANAIVVLENIVRYRAEGVEPWKAAEVGTSQIALAVLASTATNLAVFIPISTMGGITGSVFKALGLTIVFATLASLALSFTLVPLMSSRMLTARRTGSSALGRVIDRFISGMEKAYARQLRGLFHRRGSKALVLAGTAVLFFGTLLLVPYIGSEFFPQGDMGYLSVEVELPPGTPLGVTDRALRIVEKEVAQIPGVEAVSSSSGGGSYGAAVNKGSVSIKLKPKGRDRAMGADEIMALVRSRVAGIPDAEVTVRPMQMMGGGMEADLEVEVIGLEMDAILQWADSVRSVMKKTPGLTDVRLSYKGGVPELKFIPDRDRLEHYGLSGYGYSTTVQMVGGLLYAGMSGNDKTVYREGGEDYAVRVQVAPDDRATVEDVANMTIATAKGQAPLRALMTVARGEGPSSINRKNRQRMVTVTANIFEGTSGKKAAELEKIFTRFQLPQQYAVRFGGMQEIQAESFGQLTTAALLAVLLTFMVLAAMLESLSLSVLIMVTLPLGLIGVIWALFLTGNALSMMSFMSVIMLIGVVVNNAILIVDHAQHLRREKGLSTMDAAIEGAATKLKPILMMNLAIVLGTLPQALGMGSGGEMRAPFGITAIGGIVVSTLMTLYVMPVLYLIGAPREVAMHEETTRAADVP